MFSELAGLGTQVADRRRLLPTMAESFAEQWAYVTSTAAMTVVCCSRQCGKTWGARLRARLVACSTAGKKVLYVTLIRRNCRKLFFHPLTAELRAAGWSVATNEVDLTIKLPNGSVIEAVGCDDQAGLGKIRGDNYDLVIIDEAQEPSADVLERLVDQVLGPQFVTRGGSIDMLGTPPESLAGYFVDALPEGAEAHRWAFHGWTMFDAARGGVQDLAKIERAIADRGLQPGHPVYEREYLGNHLVRDPDRAAYEYEPGRNDYRPEDLPTKGLFGEPLKWRAAMGLDLGFQDHDAIVVLTWNPHDGQRRLYERYRWQARHQDVDQLSAQVKECVRAWRPVIVGDHGGHGAVKVLETLKARMGIEINAKPPDVMVSVGLVNDDFRTGRLQLEEGSPLGGRRGELLRVTRRVNPTTRRMEINKQGFHSDLSEALRYAHHAARHWAAKAPPPPDPDPLTRPDRIAEDIRRWERRKLEEERYFNGD